MKRFAGMVFVCALGLPVGADISPFGEFEWGDDLYEAIEAARQMGGEPTIRLRSGGTAFVSTEGITRERLPDLLSALIRKTIPRMYEDPRTHERLSATIPMPNGEITILSNHSTGHVRATRVPIQGVPYDVSVALEQSGGYAMLRPESVYADSTGRYSFPLFLSRVTLSSRSPTLRERIVEINRMLYDKYRQYDDPNDATLFLWRDGLILDGRVSDDRNNELRIESSPEKSIIVYSLSNDVWKETRAAYLRFLGSLDAAHGDMSSEL